MPRPATPQQISQALSLYLAFTPWEEISKVTGLSTHALRRRSARDNWPERRATIQGTVSTVEPDSPGTWVSAMRQDCESALVRLRTYPIPTNIQEETQRERLLNALDERARRAYGIDKAGNALTVNLNYMRDQPKQVQMHNVKLIDVAKDQPGDTRGDSQSNVENKAQST